MDSTEVKNKALDDQYMGVIRNALSKGAKSESVIDDLNNLQKAHFIKTFNESKKSSNVLIVEELNLLLETYLTSAFNEIKEENIYNKLLEKYDKDMEKAIEITEFESELRSIHNDSKTKIIENLSQLNLNESLLVKLEKSIDMRLPDIITYWTDQMNKQKALIETLIENVRKYYREEINKCYQNTFFIASKKLEERNEKVVKHIITKYETERGNMTYNKFEKLIRDSLNVIFNEFKNKNNANAPTLKAIGIDLGTTNSCVAYYQPSEPFGIVHVIENDSGVNTTPSVVAFDDNGDEIVGQLAKDGAFGNPKNTVYSVKRLIGRKYCDEKIQRDMKLWPFKVIDDGNNNPKISVKFRGSGMTCKYTPEEISSKILKKLKSMATEKLGFEVKNAVITVPAYFKEAQKQATSEAGALAGLNVLKIINEPTAAAIAFQLNRGNERIAKKVLIYDFGGGTLDVSILVINNGEIEVKSHGGNNHLGGDDIDNNIIDYCIKEFSRSTGKTFNKNNEVLTLRRLKTECETKKCQLSFMESVDIIITGFIETQDLRVKLTREKFEELNHDLFFSSIKCVKDVLKKANIPYKDIDDIVLVGGTTRIPRLRQMLSDEFDGKQLSHVINADEAVAVGAAIQAAIVNGVEAQNLGHLKVSDVAPFSLGVKVQGGLMSNIINCNTKIPLKYIKQYTTSSDFQREILVEIFEGEEEMAVDNNYLGKFTLSNIPSAPKGVPIINVSFEVDDEGKLNVKANIDGSNEEGSIQITDHRARLSDKELYSKIYDNR